MKRLLNCIIFIALFSSCIINEPITVPNPPEICLDSENGIYTVKVGREIVIAPNYEFADSAQFYWTMNGEVIGTAKGSTKQQFAEWANKAFNS
mgnify:CR=1 FL=1